MTATMNVSLDCERRYDYDHDQSYGLPAAMTIIIAILAMAVVVVRDIVLVTDSRVVRAEDAVIDIFAALRL